MCGIAGIVRFDDRPIDPARLAAMRESVANRGRDGSSVLVHGRCGMAHCRLAVIDRLSGEQPMSLARVHSGQGEREDGGEATAPGLRLVFNGEVYNHRRLRKQLERLGHVFSSDHSDTEVLLLGYRQWGDQLPKHLHGMFAFAIYDFERRKLLLCRDRIGKKPLFYRQSGSELVFGSTPAAVVAGLPAGERPGCDPEALRRYLCLGHTAGRSLFSGVQEPPAAHWVEVDQAGRMEARRYWRPPPVSRHSTSLGAVDALREVLVESVRMRLEADVPLGCFLSGGLDSSVVAALAQRELQSQGAGPLRAVSVAVRAPGFDESDHAVQVAKALGLDHVVLEADPRSAMDDLTDLMRQTGEPTADSSLLPTHWLCREAADHMTVALSGDGGDELFGGYDRYRAMTLLDRWRWWAAHTPAPTDRSSWKSRPAERLGRLVRAARAGREAGAQYGSLMSLFFPEEAGRIAPGLFGDASVDGPVLEDWPDEADPAFAAMRWDLTHYLPHDVLRKVDRASMAVPIEVRCPLLGTAVCDLAGHLPPRVLMPGGRPKGLLRALAAELLPLGIVQRSKRGFGVPIGAWLRESHAERWADLLGEPRLEGLGLDPEAIGRKWAAHRLGTVDHGPRLFALGQLAQWARMFGVELDSTGLSSSGPALEA
ncbi:MAG: asparagine synthase (glutamine-hydrolyzing) [Planctomycetota bacterium]